MGVEDRTELLKAVYEQHWLHARHVENERLWFTNIFGVVVAGLLAFLGTADAESLPLLAKLTGAFIFALSVLGYLLCLIGRVPFVVHTEMTEKTLRHKQLEMYSSYPPGFSKVKLFWISAHELFLYFYALMAGGGSFIALRVGLEYPQWWIGLIPSVILILAWRGLRLPCNILLIRPICSILIRFWRKRKPDCFKDRKPMNKEILAIWNILWQGLLGREDFFRKIIREQGE